MLLLLLLFLWIEGPVFLLFFFHLLDFELSQFLGKNSVIVFGLKFITIKDIDGVDDGTLVFLNFFICLVLDVWIFLDFFFSKLNHQVAIMR